MDRKGDNEMKQQQGPRPAAEGAGEDWLAEVEAERAAQSPERRLPANGVGAGSGAAAGARDHAPPPRGYLDGAAPAHGREDDAPVHGPRRRQWPAGYVLLAILIGFALGAALNAKHLQRTAEELPFGAKRSVAMALVKPIAAISSVLQLERPAALADRLLGIDRPEKVDTRQGLGVSLQSGGRNGPVTPTKSHKLVLWIGGDSMVQVFGSSLETMARQTGLVVPVLDYKISSGLVRPDFYDWPERISAEMMSLDPDVAVVMFGANDGQGMKVGGQVYPFGTSGWLKIYHKRVAMVMDELLTRGREVYWVGQPIARARYFTDNVHTMNSVYQEEALRRPHMHYVESWPLFVNSKGQYSDYLRDDSGAMALMRAADGIHLTRAGGDRLAKAVLARIAADFKFKVK